MAQIDTFGAIREVGVGDESYPLGVGADGEAVYLSDIWPDTEEIQRAIHEDVDPELFRAKSAEVFAGDDWASLGLDGR